MRNSKQNNNSPNSSTTTMTNVTGSTPFSRVDFDNLPDEVLVYHTGPLLATCKEGFDKILDMMVRVSFTGNNDSIIGDFAVRLMSLGGNPVSLSKVLEITKDLSEEISHFASVGETQLDKLVMDYFKNFSIFEAIFEVNSPGNGLVILKKKKDFSEAEGILRSCYDEARAATIVEDAQVQPTYANIAAKVQSQAIDTVIHPNNSGNKTTHGSNAQEIGVTKDLQDEYLIPKRTVKPDRYVQRTAQDENPTSNFYSGLKDIDDDEDEEEVQLRENNGASAPIIATKPSSPMKAILQDDSQLSFASSAEYDNDVFAKAKTENHLDRFIGVGNLRHEYSWDSNENHDLSFLTQRSDENRILSQIPGFTATAQEAKITEIAEAIVQYDKILKEQERKLKQADKTYRETVHKNIQVLQKAEKSYRAHDKAVRKDHDDRYNCHRKQISTQWMELMDANQQILDEMKDERNKFQNDMKNERHKLDDLEQRNKKHLNDVKKVEVHCSEMLQDTILNRQRAERANQMATENREYVDNFYVDFRKDLQQGTIIQHQLQQTQRLKRFDELEANFHDALERLHALESQKLPGSSSLYTPNMEAFNNFTSPAPASQEVSNDSSTQIPSETVDPESTETTVPDVSRTTTGEDVNFAQAFQPVEGTRTLDGTLIRHAHVHNDPTQIVSIYDIGDSHYKAIWQNSNREFLIAEAEQYIWVETAVGFQWHHVLYPIFNEDSVEYEAETLISPRETKIIRSSTVKRIHTVPKVGQFVLTHGTEWNKVITQKLSSSELCLQVQSLLDPLIISDINMNQVKKIADQPPQFAHVNLTPTSTPTRPSNGPPGGYAGNVVRSIPNANANDRSVPMQNQQHSTSTDENQQGNTEHQQPPHGYSPQQNFQQSQFNHNSPFGHQQQSPSHGSAYGNNYRQYTPNLDAYQFIYPWDPQNPQSQTNSYFKIKDFKKDKVLSKCSQLELEKGKATNFTDWYDDFVWVCNELHILLKRTDEIKVLESINDLLVPNENNCLNFDAMKKEASRVLYDLFHTTGEHLLKADRRTLSNLPTYKRRRDGLEFLFKVVKRHHPSYNTSRCRKIQFGPKFLPEEHSIFQFAHQLMDWKHEQAQPFTPLEMSKYFIEQMDSRFEIGKSLVLLEVQGLEDKYGRDVDLVNHLHLSLPNIVDHLLQRTTTDPEKQNSYSGILESPTIPSVNRTDFSRGREQSSNREFSRGREQSSNRDSRYRGRSTERTRPQDRRYNSRSTSRDSYNSKPRSASRSISQQEPLLCPICKQSARRCKDGCINVGISLSIQDYLQKYPHSNRTKLLRDYEESQDAFIKKMKDNYHKRQKARIKKVQLVERLQKNSAPTDDQITSMTESFVRTKEAEDPDLFYGAFDRSLEDDQEPMLA